MRHTDGMGDAQRSYIRRIVREELVAALQAMAREADRLDMPYETAELDSRALDNISKVAEGTVTRLTCPHEKTWTWSDKERCSRCGEPIPAPDNPFEEQA